MNKIYWLASYPKSGNTWVRIFLTNYLRNSQDPADINQLEPMLIASARSIFDDYTGVDSGDLTMQEIDRVRPAVYRAYAAQTQAPVTFCKVHDAFTCADGQPLFPQDCTAGAIYIIRNPLDVAVSYAHFNGQPIDWAIALLNDSRHVLGLSSDGIANQIHQQLLTWSQHVESWTQAEGFPVLQIRYEDMIADPVSVFGEVIQFLGMNKDPVLLERAIRFSSFEEVHRQEREKGFQDRVTPKELFFRKGKVGQWRNELSQQQVAKIVGHNSEVMRKYGYLTEDGKDLRSNS